MSLALAIAKYFHEGQYSDCIIERVLHDQDLPDEDREEALAWLRDNPRGPDWCLQRLTVEAELATGSVDVWTRFTPDLRQFQSQLDHLALMMAEQSRLLSNLLKAQQTLIELDRAERERLIGAKTKAGSAA